MTFHHVLSRGVDKRIIFLDKQDYLRFIHNLFEFNDQSSISNLGYHFRKSIDIVSRYIERKPRKLLVKIHSFCLMPNHYHLLLSPLVEGGISQFMKKVNIGYAKYFNQKYNRTGTLFEGRFKSILVEHESHFIHLPYYIHCNPLDLVMPEWREGRIRDYRKALKFLETYRWSSYLDYMGKKNFPSVTQRDTLLEFFEGEKGYRQLFTSWLRDLDISPLTSYTLE